MEARQFARRPDQRRVRDLELQRKRLRPVVDQLDRRAFRKRHVPVAVEAPLLVACTLPEHTQRQ